MLVNKYYHLNSSYEPDDLVNINNKYYYGEGHKIRKIAYDAFIDMWNQANQAGIYLIINSSYRTFQEQQKYMMVIKIHKELLMPILLLLVLVILNIKQVYLWIFLVKKILQLLILKIPLLIIGLLKMLINMALFNATKRYGRYYWI